MNDLISNRYLQKDYLDNNPVWDMEDSPWKARSQRYLKETTRLHLNFVNLGVAQVKCSAHLKIIFQMLTIVAMISLLTLCGPVVGGESLMVLAKTK